MGNFRDWGAHAASKGSKGLELNPDYFDYFSLKVGQEAVIRVLDHDIFSYLSHERFIEGKMKKIRCTGQSEDTEQKCVGCYYSNKDSEVRILNTRKVYMVTLLDLRKIHKVTTDEGKNIVKECTGARCMLCKNGLSPDVAGQKHWSLGSGHYGVLQDINLKIGDRCIACKEGKISIKNIVCSKCGEPIFSENRLGDMKEVDLKKQLFNQFTCKYCGNKDYPEEDVECTSCKEPERASILDTNIKVSKIEASDGSKYTTLSLEPTYAWEAIPEKIAKEIHKYDFPAIYPELAVNIQAAILKLKNPWEKKETVGMSEEDAESRFGGDDDEKNFLND